MSKLMNQSISNVDKPNTFRPGKKKKKKYSENINIDTNN